MEDAKNKRFIVSNQSIWTKDIAVILKKEFSPHYSITTKELSFCTVKTASFIDSRVKLILPFWNKQYNVLNDRSIRVLEIQYKPIEETLIEMTNAMI